MSNRKERFVIFNEELAGGRERVTTEEVRGTQYIQQDRLGAPLTFIDSRDTTNLSNVLASTNPPRRSCHCQSGHPRIRTTRGFNHRNPHAVLTLPVVHCIVQYRDFFTIHVYLSGFIRDVKSLISPSTNRTRKIKHVMSPSNARRQAASPCHHIGVATTTLCRGYM